MKSFRSAAVLAATLAIAASAVPARADLVITEVMPNSRVTNDWFEVTNTGPAAVDLTGYKMDDNSFAFANSVFLLGVGVLAPGQKAVFLESADTTTPGSEVAAFRPFWGGEVATGLVGYYQGAMAGVGLSANGDGVVLFNAAGTELTRITFSAATTGASFYGTSGSTSTAFTTVSVAGQNGAYNSVGTNPTSGLPDVGSPDVTNVPEPTTWVALATGALVGGFALARRRKTA